MPFFKPNLIVILFTTVIAIWPQFSSADDRILRGAIDFSVGSTLVATVDNLFPTQPSLGYQWVAGKVGKILDLSKGENGKAKRRSYLLKNPVPVVVGPGGRLYIVDHHHLARAVIESGHSKLYVEVVGNFSKENNELSEDERVHLFWEKMKSLSLAYLRDDILDREISHLELPTHIKEMPNDEFRSLAGLIRDAKKNPGFIKKAGDYFVEFKWARALRRHFLLTGYKSKTTFWSKDDVEIGLEFAHSELAKGLLGYIGDTCQILFK